MGIFSSELDLEAFKAAAEALMEGNGGQVTWTWDSRFEAVLLQLPRAQAPSFYDFLKAEFMEHWVPQTVVNASAPISEVIFPFGGLKPGQELFSTDSEQPTFLAAAWWPWQSGDQVSVRLFLRTSIFSLVDVGEEIRQAFGLA